MDANARPPSRSVGELEQLYRDRYPRFLRLAVAMLGEVEPGRDAVHEAFVRAIGSIDGFRGEGTLEGWVWRTLVNVCLIEKRHRLPALELSESEWRADDEWPEVRAAIAGLPERQRTTLFLRHYADLDYDQIGAVLGVTRGTVAASLHAAHAKLRDVLEEMTK